MKTKWTLILVLTIGLITPMMSVGAEMDVNEPSPDPSVNANNTTGTVASAPPGLGADDPWVDANGDTMFGDLVLGRNGILLNGRELSATTGGALQFDGQNVCFDTGTCGGVTITGVTPIVVDGTEISLANGICDAGEVWKWTGSSWDCTTDEDTNTDTLASLSCASAEVAKWDGSAWTCSEDADTDTTYVAGTGLTLSGTTFNVDKTTVQLRVTGACGPHAAMASVNADGSVTCQPLWGLQGNSGTNSTVHFLGTTDATNLTIKVNGTEALRIEPTTGTPNIVAGNASNTATEDGAVIAGGGTSTTPNTVTARFGTIGGGVMNSAEMDYTTVAGGYNNTAGGYSGWSTDAYAAVAGGRDNLAFGMAAFVGGGMGNEADNDFSTVAGGRDNLARATATVGGGSFNEALGTRSTVAGGSENVASNVYATVGGGLQNEASGSYATVPGGDRNTALGIASLAAGRMANASHDGAFVWADSNTYEFPSTAADQFRARATGGAEFVSAIDSSGNPTAGVTLAPGSGSWSSLSDRNAKEHIESVDGQQVLDRLATVPIYEWSYKAQADGVRHVGPMAQDFHAAFDVGADDTRISTVDADGVALAAIQGLNAKVEAQQATIEEQQETIQEQQAQLDEMDARLTALEEAVNEDGSLDTTKDVEADPAPAPSLLDRVKASFTWVANLG